MAVVLSGRTEDLLFGVVRFDPGDDEQAKARECVITFNSTRSADRYAVEKGWFQYQVIPLRFFVTDLGPPAGSHVHLAAAMARLTEHRGGER